MDKIKEVQQILNNHALPTDNGGFIRDDINGDKFNKVATDVVKLLDLHFVRQQRDMIPQNLVETELIK